MINSIPLEITVCSFSLVGVMTGYIWNSLEKRLKKCEQDICKIPTLEIKESIVSIQKDIDWIKKYLIKN